jgi:hypothetical protein
LVSRALPAILSVLLVTGLLAAAVVASPRSGDASASRDRAAGPLALMGQQPAGAAPLLEDFQPPPARPGPRPRPGRRSRPVARAAQIPPTPAGRPSRAIGKPWRGRLENAVQFPADGAAFFTWDAGAQVSPSAWWRRCATDTTVARTLAVLTAFHAAHPGGPRLGVGDLSLPRGGPFGPEYGGLGHNSHQNGLDVDIYWPRRDRAERAPERPSLVDRALSQDLVDRLVAAGAEYVFVGPSLHLHGPRGVVQPLVYHDNHAHVRWPKR